MMNSWVFFFFLLSCCLNWISLLDNTFHKDVTMGFRERHFLTSYKGFINYSDDSLIIQIFMSFTLTGYIVTYGLVRGMHALSTLHLDTLHSEIFNHYLLWKVSVQVSVHLRLCCNASCPTQYLSSLKHHEDWFRCTARPYLTTIMTVWWINEGRHHPHRHVHTETGGAGLGQASQRRYSICLSSVTAWYHSETQRGHSLKYET